ncbi:MAG: hypothetical protein IH987_00035 [Planctomycetes bacterium]|nr:hypothetical protein [Planctomycetota bacterium]
MSDSGGPISIRTFTRLGEGEYRIVYNISTVEAGIGVAIIATGIGVRTARDFNGLTIVSVSQAPLERLLTVDVFTATNVIIGTRLAELDALFSLAIFGN